MDGLVPSLHAVRTLTPLLERSSVIHRIAWRSVFHRRKLVNDGPTGHRRRRRAFGASLTSFRRGKKMPPCEQWLNNEQGAVLLRGCVNPRCALAGAAAIWHLQSTPKVR